MSRPLSSIRATVDGLLLTVRAPGLLLAIVIVTLLSAIPFAFVVESAVMDSLALQPPADTTASSEIDAEWWLDFRRQATGLAATFTPAILGFAAPLDNVSALLDGTRRPIALAVPVALTAIVWAFLWGGILSRFASGMTSAGAFMAAATRHFAKMLMLTLLAAAASVVLYLSLHAVLFGPVYESIAGRMSTERDAFLVRVALYLVFGTVLVLVNAVFSFARVAIVSENDSSIAGAITRGSTFARTHLGSVASLYLIFIAIFAVAMVAYGGAELAGGSRVGGWRAIAIGQAFIALRLALRLALAASQVRLAHQSK